MKKQAYQVPELRDASNNVIQAGTYGRTSPLVNADNTGVLDYINNNLEALHDMLSSQKTYVASKADLPAAGDAGTIYVASDTGVWYGWDGVKKAYVAYSDPRTAADEAKASETAAKQSADNCAEYYAKAQTASGKPYFYLDKAGNICISYELDTEATEG